MFENDVHVVKYCKTAIFFWGILVTEKYWNSCLRIAVFVCFFESFIVLSI